MKEIEKLREYMQSVVGSASFQDLEQRKDIDFSSLFGENKSSSIKQALSDLLASQISNFEGNLATDLKVDNSQIELIVNTEAN
jgi:hypothetical protein